MAKSWQLQEAKSRLSELIVEAEANGPQTITKRGIETAIVMSAKDYRKLLGKQSRLSEYFRNSPLYGVDLDLQRVDDRGRATEIA